MSRSLWTIAELVWRQINPRGKDEAKNTLEEYVERAKDEYASVLFNSWLQLKNDNDLSMIEQLLVRRKYEVQEGEEGLFSELDMTVLDFPKDLGVFRVQPPKSKRPLTKTTLGTMDLFEGDPGEKTYYRLGSKIFYPEGFDQPTKEVMITIVSGDFIDDNLDVPEIFASAIENALTKAYGTTANIKEDVTDNQKADS